MIPVKNSDFGILIKPNFTKELVYYNNLLRENLYKYGFIIFRGFDVSKEEAIRWFKSLGVPIEYSFGDVLIMENKKETEESQFTHREMSIHQDTILNESQKATTLAFYCDVPPLKGKGETLLVDNRKVLQALPTNIKKILSNHPVIYTTNTNGYYKGSGIVSQRAITQHPITKEETLFIALDDYLDPSPNYRASFTNLTENESQKVMIELDSIYRMENCLYEHSWEKGDLLILDNFYVSHGRNSFHKGDERRLVRVSLMM